MNIKKYLSEELKIPKEYFERLDLSAFPKIVNGTPAWASYYKIIRWLKQKREKAIENEERYDRFRH